LFTKILLEDDFQYFKFENDASTLCCCYQYKDLYHNCLAELNWIIVNIQFW